MTATEFRDRTFARIAALRDLEYRLQQARAHNLRIRGWVLTHEEADALCVVPGGRCWVDGRLVQVAKVIPSRTAV
jgi:hypothetical protein